MSVSFPTPISTSEPTPAADYRLKSSAFDQAMEKQVWNVNDVDTKLNDTLGEMLSAVASGAIDAEDGAAQFLNQVGSIADAEGGPEFDDVLVRAVEIAGEYGGAAGQPKIQDMIDAAHEIIGAERGLY